MRVNPASTSAGPHPQGLLPSVTQGVVFEALVCGRCAAGVRGCDAGCLVLLLCPCTGTVHITVATTVIAIRPCRCTSSTHADSVVT